MTIDLNNVDILEDVQHVVLTEIPQMGHNAKHPTMYLCVVGRSAVSCMWTCRFTH